MIGEARSGASLLLYTMPPPPSALPTSDGLLGRSRVERSLVRGMFMLLSAVTLASFRPYATEQFIIDLTPRQPVQGGFVEITVRVQDHSRATMMTGRLAGQTLYFESHDSVAWHTLGGIPVTATSDLQLTLVGGRAGEAPLIDTVSIPVQEGRFGVEQLRVNPRFSRKPDSALSARIAREYQRAMQISRASFRTPRLWSGPFQRPRPTRVTSRFGRGREFNGELQSRHLGVDLAGSVGAPVVAPNRGVVALVDSTYYGGNVVYLDHGRGLVTAYLHLSRATVSVGDTVLTGMPIGRVGATGRVTAAHLHWIARFGTVTLNPLSLEQLPLAAFDRPEP